MSIQPSVVTEAYYRILLPCCITASDLVRTSTLPDVMSPSDEVEVTISGGCAPYYWKTTSTDFSWAVDETVTLSNTLTCNALGSPTSSITINDSCFEEGGSMTEPISIPIQIATEDATGTPYAIIFDADANDCYNDGLTTEINLTTTFPITTVTVVNVGCSSTGTNPVSLTVPEDYSTTVSLSVNMVATGYTKIGGGVPTGNSVASVDHCSCVEDAEMAWDAATSATTIGQSSEATVAVTGNNYPFTWSVTGGGYTMKYDKTAGLTNTVQSNGSACGAAVVTCVGCDGESVSGELKGTSGTWVQLPGDAGYCYDVPDRLSHYTFEVIGGTYKTSGREYCSSDGPSVNACCPFCQNLYNICTYCALFNPDRIANVEQFCYHWECP